MSQPKTKKTRQVIHKYHFDFSPKIIQFLGEELIHDKKIAISELVKNAYDADASKVIITVEEQQITIEDNGWGMDAHIIKEHWLKPGNSNKKSQNPTPKYHRLPIGEKGVGRLGVHKLGNHIEIISKPADAKEVSFKIDWEVFAQSEHLKDLTPIQVQENNTPTHFKNSTGTLLVIKKLKETLSDKDMNTLHSDLLKLLPPFANIADNNFSIELRDNRGTFESEGELNISDIIGQAMFYYKVIVNKGEIKEFTYRFSSPIKDRLPSKMFSLKDLHKELPAIQESWQKSNKKVESVGVGDVVFQGYIFDAKYSKLAQPLTSETKNYLKENGGIRVYRDGMRVYNYGEEGRDNDILNLDRKRAKRLGDNIGYNQILASIGLDRAHSRDLIEKTNREGFVHNQAFLSLQQDLDLCLETVLHYRKIDRANMDPFLGKEFDRADLETKIKKVTSVINKLAVADKEKQNLTNKLHEFSHEFEQLKNIFLHASITGINMTLIVHEIDKIMDHLDQEIKARNVDQIAGVFSYLQENINHYKNTINLSKKPSNLLVTELIEQVIFNFRYRLDHLNIGCSTDLTENLEITGRKNLILGVFINLVDNAIYWLNCYQDIADKKILIRAYEHNGHVIIIFADTGRGFNINFEAALHPFITGRFDESGMGMGLHLANQIMSAHQGSIEHGNWKEEKLPPEFANGAIIKLRFKKS